VWNGIAREQARGAEAMRENESPSNVPIEDLNLTVRVLNCLKRNGLTSVGAVLALEDQELEALPNLGPHGYRELKGRLVSEGFLNN
jgi:DNA-directed RNA polymerase subunit alpha